MAKTPFNIQDQYLNQARKERVRVTVVMMSGEKLEFRTGQGLLDILGEVSDPAALADSNVPAVRRDLPGQEPEQGGLAGAVGTHQADALSGVHLETDVLKQYPPRKVDGEV